MLRAFDIAIGFGSNVGDRMNNLRQAMHLVSTAGLRELSRSSIYETPPWGVQDQPRFLNAVVLYRGAIEPFLLLRRLKEIECLVGRRPTYRWGPREIDLDLLLFGEFCLTTPTLSLPHPGLSERAFVLGPLVEIAPNMKHPLRGSTIKQLLSALGKDAMEGTVRISRQ